ncbi:putative regulatory protein, FmdB family [Calidithermus terrae]|uniref:Putative regulatory protein, FmdB family n=1 Tax=Calidithermus terrae TaxID=1408545 RepID=A0A399EG48_9DEIN|nr:FmdB family transcriptional regulator [Calidithermus terrae]RIH82119.1 putative regulatory protein, FmdB family [Calidithermus terrae]
MPVYVYEGLETGNRYEFEQRFSDAAYTHHPETGEPIKRVISAPAVIFKGSGWYVKDSKSASSAAGKGEGKSEPSSQAAD